MTHREVSDEGLRWGYSAEKLINYSESVLYLVVQFYRYLYNEKMPIPTDYNTKAISEIYEWKNPAINWFDKTMDVVNAPFNKLGDWIGKILGADLILDKVIIGLMSILNDFAQRSVHSDAILEKYRLNGHKHINNLTDMYTLDLRDDRTMGFLSAKYKSLFRQLRELLLGILDYLESGQIY